MTYNYYIKYIKLCKVKLDLVGHQENETHLNHLWRKSLKYKSKLALFCVELLEYIGERSRLNKHDISSLNKMLATFRTLTLSIIGVRFLKLMLVETAHFVTSKGMEVQRFDPR